MAGAKGRSGRPATTSHDEIAKHASALFEDRGFAAVTVTDIAVAAGIARRTFFSYFASKADAFWHEDETELISMERTLSEVDPGTEPLGKLIEISMLSPAWNNKDRAAVRGHYQMINSNPELQIGAMRFQRRWVRAIAAYIRRTTNTGPDDLLPDVAASAMISVASIVLSRWAYGDNDDLQAMFLKNIELLRSAFESAIREKMGPLAADA